MPVFNEWRPKGFQYLHLVKPWIWILPYIVQLQEPYPNNVPCPCTRRRKSFHCCCCSMLVLLVGIGIDAMIVLGFITIDFWSHKYCCTSRGTRSRGYRRTTKIEDLGGILSQWWHSHSLPTNSTKFATWTWFPSKSDHPSTRKKFKKDRCSSSRKSSPTSASTENSKSSTLTHQPVIKHSSL